MLKPTQSGRERTALGSRMGVCSKGGLEGMDFTWGNKDTQLTNPMANTWQGEFPYQNLLIDKYKAHLPVGSFARMDMVYLIWQEMFGNGLLIGMSRIWMKLSIRP
ncbi:MAG: hypothetical protein P0116_12725 [Candidatus Nitrosocosmicus sp.]|nr:hypothetical protein [Candidatus Nitrosocosmicus sp.]